MKSTTKTIYQKSVKQQATEILDNLSVEEACFYLDKHCTEQEREDIIAAIWDVYHARRAKKK